MGKILKFPTTAGRADSSVAECPWESDWEKACANDEELLAFDTYAQNLINNIGKPSEPDPDDEAPYFSEAQMQWLHEQAEREENEEEKDSGIGFWFAACLAFIFLW